MKKFVSAILALLLVSSISVCVFAATPSRQATVKKDHTGGTATYTYKPKTGDITVTVDLKKGYKFKGWTISSDYEIVSGSLNSTTLVLRPKKGVEVKNMANIATPAFTKDSSSTTKKSSGGGSSSPKTSDNGMAIPMLALLALGGVVVSSKKLSK